MTAGPITSRGTPVDLLIRELRDHPLFFGTQPGDTWPPLAILAITAPDGTRLAEARQVPNGWRIGTTHYPTGHETQAAAHLRRLAEDPTAD